MTLRWRRRDRDSEDLGHPLQGRLPVPELRPLLRRRHREQAVDEPAGEPIQRTLACTGPKALVLATSTLSSTRVSAVLTDCPPGPDEWLNLQRNSRVGTRIERLMRSGPTMRAV